MEHEELCVTRQDYERLCRYLSGEAGAAATTGELREFAEELAGRRVVDSLAPGAGVVAMGSVVRVMDIATKESFTAELAYPEEADLNRGRLSVLAPLGAALLGRRTGDVFEWRSASRLRRLLVKEVSPGPAWPGGREPAYEKAR